MKLYATFHHHMWIQTGVTVRKRLSFVMTSVTLTFDHLPWPFAWTSLLSLVISPANFVMIWWSEHSQKGVTHIQTDRRTDGQTDWTVHRAAWSQLKNINKCTLSLNVCLFRGGWGGGEGLESATMKNVGRDGWIVEARGKSIKAGNQTPQSFYNSNPTRPKTAQSQKHGLLDFF